MTLIYVAGHPTSAPPTVLDSGDGVEPPTFVADVAVDGGVVRTMYYKTPRHDARGYRVYDTALSIWPANATLGWVGPPAVVVVSDFDRVTTRWVVSLHGNKHVITLYLSPMAVVQGHHKAALDRAAARLGRASHHVRVGAG